ncbi:hypothetical protein [Pedobacter sp. UBA4863]|uniref:hypothetical protein n=1 Tax=Pedobacter sp. UBA4863 TaxID=1947060 RepID=UPI0025D6A591|nr:hypothetical protein [Pedobacter sp. UBA4863]
MMDNPKILKLLERQRDILFDKLKGASISGLYKEQYADIKAGRVFVFDNGERRMLNDLKKLSKETSHDTLYEDKLAEYLQLDNNALVSYFQNELDKVFKQIIGSGRQDEIQALFIEYDYYYHFTSSITCCGRQEYPSIEEPRYISNEYDYNKQILFLDKVINFKLAWVDCEEFSNLDYLEINYQLEDLFKLHSRVLIHKAIEILNDEGKMNFVKIRPFTFYIKEHDSEVMILYRLN